MSARRGILATGLAALVAALLGACGSPGSAEKGRVAAKTAATVVTAAPTVDAASKTSEPRTQPHNFSFKAQPLPARIRRRVKGRSWHQGCPVALSQLRFIQMNHWGFDRKVHNGVMIVNATAVSDLQSAFARLFDKRFPIRKMRLVDDYGADDFDSIEADNSSSFNCRRATGSTRWSEHAYGRAIDINPIENPYVYANGTTVHRASRTYLDRSRIRPGMSIAGRTLVSAFAAAGWRWGGRWSPAKDLQHFSATGR